MAKNANHNKRSGKNNIFLNRNTFNSCQPQLPHKAQNHNKTQNQWGIERHQAITRITNKVRKRPPAYCRKNHSRHYYKDKEKTKLIPKTGHLINFRISNTKRDTQYDYQKITDNSTAQYFTKVNGSPIR